MTGLDICVSKNAPCDTIGEYESAETDGAAESEKGEGCTQ